MKIICWEGSGQTLTWSLLVVHMENSKGILQNLKNRLIKQPYF